MNARQRSALARRAAVVLAFAFAGFTGHAPVLAETAAANRSLEPSIEPARGEKCVADPAFMRRNHMELLKHQRNETVHLGVRDVRASLKGCIACHASAATGSVAQAKTDFCVNCHSYAAVKIDCFECHASKPQAVAALPPDLRHASAATPRQLAQWQQGPAQPANAR